METQSAAVAKTSVLTQGFRNELDLLGRHVRMLQFVEKHGPIGIIRLSSLLGEPRHKVRYSLRILQKEGYIRPSTQGAMITEKVTVFFGSIKELLGEVEGKIGELLKSLEKPH